MKEITNGVSFDLTDTYGESIRCVAFGAAGEYCKRELKLNELCYVMDGKIQLKSDDYPSYTTHACEIIIFNEHNVKIRQEDPATDQNVDAPPAAVTPIANLNDSVDNFKIHGRVTLMDDKRRPEKVFSFEITDVNGYTIRCVAFGELGVRLYGSIAKDQSYYLTGGKVKNGHTLYNQTGHAFEIILDEFPTIEPAPAVLTVPKLNLNRVMLCNVQNEQYYRKPIDVIVAVEEINDFLDDYHPIENKPPVLRNMVVIDDSNFRIRLTLWGYRAMDSGVEEFQNKIVAFKGIVPTQFEGEL